MSHKRKLWKKLETSSTLPSTSLARLESLSKKTTTTATPSLQTETPTNEKRGSDGALVRSQTNRAALSEIEFAMGGREAMVDVLSLAPLDKKQEHFLRLLCDPARASDNLATIVRDAGMLPSQVLSLFREASFTKAHIISMGQLAERVPAIVQDLADKSLDAVIKCPDCIGSGNGDGTDACMTCHGRGTVMRPGDLDHKKVALELGGLLKKGPGVNVNVQQNNMTTTAPGGYFSRFVKSTDADAYNVKLDAIDGEVSGS